MSNTVFYLLTATWIVKKIKCIILLIWRYHITKQKKLSLNKQQSRITAAFVFVISSFFWLPSFVILFLLLLFLQDIHQARYQVSLLFLMRIGKYRAFFLLFQHI